MIVSENLQKGFDESLVHQDVLDKLNTMDIFPEYRERLLKLLGDLSVSNDDLSEPIVEDEIMKGNVAYVDFTNRTRQSRRREVMDKSEG